MQIFSVYDVILTPIYIVVIFVIAGFLRTRLTDHTTKRYYFPALGIKLFGGIAFALLYHFYYGGGDTTAFYIGSQRIWRTFLESPVLGVELLFTDAGDTSTIASRYVRNVRFFYSANEWNLIRVAGIFSLFCFNTHLVLSCFFAFFCFLGLWQFYRTALKFFPSFHLVFAIAVFLPPSVIFWGSGIMKDTIALGSLGFLFASSMNVVYFRKRTFFQLSILMATSILLYSMKSYLLLIYIAAFAIWGFLKFQESLKNPVLKLLSLPFATVTGLVVGYFGVTQIAQSTEYNSIETIQERVYIYQMDHTLRAGGSTYSLDVDVTSPISVIAAFPQAINVTLFRPYPWEASSIVVFITSAEATIYFLVTLYILFTTGPFQTFRNVFGDPELAMFLAFTITFAFAIGITSYNFGALARFKIQLLPFFGCALAILYRKPKVKRKMKYVIDTETVEKIENLS